MGAIAISYIMTAFLSLFMLWMHLPKKNGGIHVERTLEDPDPSFITEVYQYFLPVGITLLCFMILTNVDLILVKHFFPPIEAGYYSIAQMVGKIILFLPIPVVMVMFPKLSSLEGQEKKAHSILTQSLVAALLFCVVAVLFGLLFPSLIIRVLSGKIYLECIPLVRLFCVNMTFYSLVLILLYYHLSTHQRKFLYPLFFLTLVQISLMLFFHKTLMQVLIIMGIVSASLLSVNLYWAYRHQAKGV